MDEKIVIELPDKMLILELMYFDGTLNVDDCLRIDYTNILGECLTYPLVFNRIGIMKSEVDNAVREAKFDLEVLAAQLKNTYRKNLSKESTDAKGAVKITKATQDEVDTAIILDQSYIDLNKAYYRLLKQADIMENLYWSAKSKDNKLNKLSEKIRPEDFSGELIIDTINNVLIKHTPKIFG